MTRAEFHFPDSPFSSSLSALLLAFSGALIGAVVILFGATCPEQDCLVKQPEFLVWFTLIIFLTSLLALFSVPLWLSLGPMRPFFTHHKLTILLATFIVALFFMVPLPFSWLTSGGPRLTLEYHSTKMFIINLLALFTILPAIIGIQLIDTALRTTFSSMSLAAADKEQLDMIQRHLTYRRALQRYISVLGILIGIVTLATGALRNLAIANDLPEEDFPVTIVLVYGLYYTAILILLYAPTFFRLTETGRALRDQIVPLSSINSLSDVVRKRQEIDMILQLNVTTGQSIRTAVAILTPLLSGLLTTLLSS